jgi:predicted DNA-binding protein
MSEFPKTAGDVAAFMDKLTYLDEEPPADIPPPPADHDVMVVTSLRLPLALHERLKAAAEARGKPFSTLVREWIELELANLENDQPISRADALRALATLRPHRDIA